MKHVNTKIYFFSWLKSVSTRIFSLFYKYPNTLSLLNQRMKNKENEDLDQKLILDI